MARFDVRRLRTKTRISLVVELQSDYMREIPTVLVAPLVSTKQLKPYDLINPVVEIGGEKMALRLEQIAGIPAALLGDVVASVSEAEDAISVAINRLLFYV
jgi:hypothetical protein